MSNVQKQILAIGFCILNLMIFSGNTTYKFEIPVYLEIGTVSTKNRTSNVGTNFSTYQIYKGMAKYELDHDNDNLLKITTEAYKKNLMWCDSYTMIIWQEIKNLDMLKNSNFNYEFQVSNQRNRTNLIILRVPLPTFSNSENIKFENWNLQGNKQSEENSYELLQVNGNTLFGDNDVGVKVSLNLINPNDQAAWLVPYNELQENEQKSARQQQLRRNYLYKKSWYLYFYGLFFLIQIAALSVLQIRLNNYENQGLNLNENRFARFFKPLNHRALDYSSISFSAGLTVSICFHAVKENGYKIFSPICFIIIQQIFLEYVRHKMILHLLRHVRNFNGRGLASPYFMSIFLAFMLNFTIDKSYFPLLIGGYTLQFEIYKVIKQKTDEISKLWIFFDLLIPILVHYVIYSTDYTDVYYPTAFYLGTYLTGGYLVLILLIIAITWYNFYIQRHLYQPRTVMVENLLPRNENNVDRVDMENQSDDDLDDCAICLQNLKLKKEDNAYMEVLMTPCKHYFHKECLEIWVRNHSDCPICRRECRQT